MRKTTSYALATSLLVGAYMGGSAASASIVADDLLTASRSTTPWLECGTDAENINVTDLGDGGCAYRTTPVEPGITYSLTCGIVVFKAASITLAYLDADGNTLSSEVNNILEHNSGVYSVSHQAPAGTDVAAIGIYGEPGSGFQDCALVDATPMPEPTKGSISGVTWFDETGDSLFDSAESTITGTPVTLSLNGNIIDQTTTDGTGNYYFGNLDVDACYTVGFTAVDSTLELGANTAQSDAAANGMTQDVCLTEAQPDVVDVDAAFVAVPPPAPPADLAVCGVAWLDGNGNGSFGSGDSILRNVDVVLTQVGEGQIAVSSTNSSGTYYFSDLAAGQYSVQFSIPDGHEPTTFNANFQTGNSNVDAVGNTPNFSLVAASGTSSSACTLQNVNAGFVELPTVLPPTIANNDEAEQDIGIDFSVAVLDNDEACNGVHEVNLLGHNVPGSVMFNPETQAIDVTSTTVAGTYSIEYGVRGVCGSLDTATVNVVLNPVQIAVSPSAPDAPICRVETGGNTRNGGVDVFNAAENGFAPEYNMYDRDGELVVSVSSDDYTHRYQIQATANQNEFPYFPNWEIEWNGTNYGYNQVSVFFVSAVENGIESARTECDRLLISPIALDLENKGRIARVIGDFDIDLNNDGINEALSQWFAPSAGILVTDDAEGQISGKQLFGNVPGVYTDGFAELAVRDTNEDGQLTKDELSGLAIWNDLNSDTKVDEGELSSLADHAIVSLAVTHYKFMARAKKSNGKSILMEDVWLPQAPMAALSR